MRWSVKIGRFFGIDLYMHFTFLLLVGYIAVAHAAAGDSALEIAAGVGFVLAVFGCVVLHEYGHALTARRYGVPTRDITLLPIGGVARLERIPDKPMQEFWVAVAGPAVNVVIAAALFAWLSLTGALQPMGAEMLTTDAPFLQLLMMVNVMLIAFNMLPAFPMDGGRVLRSLLATRMDYARATGIAAATGKVMAVLFALWGFGLLTPLHPKLTYNPFLVFIAMVVWFGASQELAMARIRSALSGIPVFRAMQNQFARIEPDDTIYHAAAVSNSTGQTDFPVTAGNQVVGVLLFDDLQKALEQQGAYVPVARVMRTEFKTVQAGDMLEEVVRDAAALPCPVLPVLHYGQLVGLLNVHRIGEFLQIPARHQAEHLASKSTPQSERGA